MRAPSFTIRWLMAVVAIVAAVIIMEVQQRRSDAMRPIAAAHLRAWIESDPNYVATPSRPSIAGQISPARRAYHRAMFEKYNKATSKPWLLISPDPPEPK